MEQALRFHPKSQIFFGREPRSIEECAKQASLLLQFFPTDISHDNTKNIDGKFTDNNSKPFRLETPSLVQNAFRFSLTADEPVSLIKETVENMLKQEVDTFRIKGNALPKKKRLMDQMRRQWSSTKRLSPQQLWKVLTNTLSIDIDMFLLNYFELQEDCELIC